ncbi:hypothetical protein WICMUC_001836 [Wickerhamomyces mucosus]|uniref:Upf1 domain-containing protein n=1 Tax=Wickerhamomyces mucosus TaxID=1378264 RepID=A0A9P8PRT2_9ASCO|nr:hypothetical protein WICMUC_001836 [Wickerhamomyces mucosus]
MDPNILFSQSQIPILDQDQYRYNPPSHERDIEQYIDQTASEDSEDEDEDDEDEDDEDEDSEYLEIEEQNQITKLPDHACSYCGIHTPASVVKCVTCNKWFCNGKSGNSSSSHIITHLVMSKHNTVALHADSDFGDTTLECYNCGNRNVFVLGFVSAKAEHVIVILCRLPCAQIKDSRWDTSEWTSLIENRELLDWVAATPTEEDIVNSRIITTAQISKLESKWKLNKDATIHDVEKPEEENEIVPILMRYNDAYEYQRSFGPLVKLESDYDKQLKESQALNHISVKWSIALNNKHLAAFQLSTFESELKVAVGDEMILRYNSLNHEAWEGRGYIIRIPNAYQKEYTLELNHDLRNPPPTQIATDFTAEFVWKGTSYERMQIAMRDFATDNQSVSGYIYHKLLGHEVDEVEFDIQLPSKFSIPGFAELNVSQANAIKKVLQKPLSLIQGPPGTGKTVTSATIIYHLSKINKGRILVCAPSNVAVDHLASKLDSLGMNVIRLTAKSREDVESSVEHLSLVNIVSKTSKGALKKLFKLKNETGELSQEDSKTFYTLLRKKEMNILKKADVVCCTCVGAGDKRLSGLNFRTVLIDESTQSSEPECLIPIVRGARQVVLVGDHQQLGPVILDKKAGHAGLKQSLFERLVVLGHVPIRLEVQYRMNPCLSEFSSNMFYEGSLQNGVTKEQRTIPNSTFPWPVADNPMMFWGTHSREEIAGNGTSYLNRIEAMNCERVITRLFRDGVKPDQIGVITPYEGQRAYIVQLMQMNGTMDKTLYSQVEVASVDAFQGREKDFIILSCVRANDDQNIGFLRDPRRMNVGLTRAKYGVVILGNARALSKNPLWNQLLLHYREKGCLVEGTLDNLHMSTVQLTKPHSKFNTNRIRPNFGKFGAPSVVESIGTDFDTASLVSYSPDNESVSFSSQGQQGNKHSALPSFFSKSQWPNFNEQSFANSSNDYIDSFNGNGEVDSYDTDRIPQVSSSYSSKLQSYGSNGAFEDSLTSGFNSINISH